MSEQTPSSSDLHEISQRVPPVKESLAEGMAEAPQVMDKTPERRADAIEMMGEEAAAGYTESSDSQVSAGIRYLHHSRTIHQLVTDRNRAVGLYLAVATLLWTASTALLNASSGEQYIIPLQEIQKWCLPFTFAVLTVLAVLVAFLLIRTRVGLIYEVAKMNVLLGLPLGRVKRINPLSIFFIMQLIISLGGGVSSALLSTFLLRLAGWRIGTLGLPATIVGVVMTLGLLGLYILSVLHITSEKKLQGDVDESQPTK